MTQLIPLLMAFFLIIPILYFSPLGLTTKGKMLLSLLAFFISGFSLLIKPYVPIWQTFLSCFLLIVLCAYFVYKYAGDKVVIERTDFKKDNKLDFRTYEESSHLPVFLDKEREHEEKVESPIEADVFPHTNLLKSELDGEESLVLNEADSEKALSHTNQGEVPKELVKNESTLTTRDERLEEDDLESLLEKEKDHAPAFHKWEEADQMLNSDPEEKYYLESLFAETEEEEFTTDSSSLQPRDREEHLSQQEDSIFISQEGMLKDGWQEEDFIDPFDEYELDKRLKINDKKTAGLPKHKLDHALDSSLEKRNS